MDMLARTSRRSRGWPVSQSAVLRDLLTFSIWPQQEFGHDKKT